MAAAKRYRFVGACGVLQIVLGCLLILAAAVTAFAVLSPWRADIAARLPPESRALLAPATVAGLVMAIVIGAVFILSGQLLLLMRDIHGHLARLDRRDRRRRRVPGSPGERPGVTSRLLPRRTD
jgi:uncharacterized iron-regulated membrane protein